MGASIPFELVVWDAQDCADYLRQQKSTFLKRTQFSDGFPARLQIPGQPRWAAKDVASWALSRQIPAKAA